MTKANELKIEGTVDTCSSCGYSVGFHVSFETDSETTRIILICPQCRTRSDPKWEVNITST